MDQPDRNPTLSADLIAEVEALAAAENRPSRDIVQEAVERFLLDRRPAQAGRSEAQAAADRILAHRHRHPLPEGDSIRSLMTHGRM